MSTNSLKWQCGGATTIQRRNRMCVVRGIKTLLSSPLDYSHHHNNNSNLPIFASIPIPKHPQQPHLHYHHQHHQKPPNQPNTLQNEVHHHSRLHAPPHRPARQRPPHNHPANHHAHHQRPKRRQRRRHCPCRRRPTRDARSAPWHRTRRLGRHVRAAHDLHGRHQVRTCEPDLGL